MGIGITMNELLELEQLQANRASSSHLSEISANLEKVSAEERVRWALERFRPDIMLSTSFGVQSAVLLHMVTQQWSGHSRWSWSIRAIFFRRPTALRTQLTERLKLNLKVYRAAGQRGVARSASRQNVGTRRRRHREVQPDQQSRADAAGDPRAERASGWITGLRRQQAKSRKEVGVLQTAKGHREDPADHRLDRQDDLRLS